MGENLADFLFDVSMTVLFVAALSLFLVFNPLSEKTVDLLENAVNRDRQVTQNVVYEAGYPTVTGAVIIGDIMNGLDTDITVDGVPFSRREAEEGEVIGEVTEEVVSDEVFSAAATYDFSAIEDIDADAYYKVINNIDANGRVTSVDYEHE